VDSRLLLEDVEVSMGNGWEAPRLVFGWQASKPQYASTGTALSK
jgi:hypothetical protein